MECRKCSGSPPLSAIAGRLTSITSLAGAHASAKQMRSRYMSQYRPNLKTVIRVADTVLSIYPEPDTCC